MRYLIGSQIAWGIVPALIVVGAAYVWVADRLVNRKAKTATHESVPSVEKAA